MWYVKIEILNHMNCDAHFSRHYKLSSILQIDSCRIITTIITMLNFAISGGFVLQNNLKYYDCDQ